MRASNPSLEPKGEVVEAIFQVSSARFDVARPSNSDREHKENQAAKQDDENKHGNEVEHQKPRDSPKRSEEARKSHKEDDDTKHNDRPLQKLHAGIVGLGGEPDPGADDGNREKQSDEVYASDNIVAQCHLERGCLGEVFVGFLVKLLRVLFALVVEEFLFRVFMWK